MKKVREGLYIGNFFDMYMVLEDNQRVNGKITHILSLLPPGPLQISFERGEQSGLRGRKSLSEGNLAGRIGGDNSFASPEIRTGDCSVEMVGRSSQIMRMKVSLNDHVTENLLNRLEACLDFIHGARQRGGTVLVHCMAGVSRSASVIVAYLMRTENLSFQDALSSLRKESPTASPNKGFIDQLVMFGQMGCKVDPTHPVCKSFKASRTDGSIPRKA
uniref:Tyrosine-protein phosphatase domain-containing protein n=1 Tax=Araucaria cunninghamii TaxID=56994 RepID=A0A0D6R7I8_ARACU